MTARHRIGAGRALRRRERQMPGLASALARSVRSGASLLGALDEVAHVAPAPLCDELRGVVVAVEHGRSLDDALARWSAEAGSPSVDLLVAACRFGHRDGGHVAAALDGAAVSLLDALDAADESRAMTSQARSSAGVLVALPVLGAAVFSMLDPDVLHTLTMTTAGRACVVAGAGLDAVGAWVMARLVRSAVS